MSLLLFKLALTPLLVVCVSLVARRWGETLGAWMVGLPLTSGPISVFLAIERGPHFAYEASAGSMAGVAAQAFFCIGFGLAARFGRAAAMGAGTAFFLATALAMRALLPMQAAPAITALAALLLSWSILTLLPHGDTQALSSTSWDLPARAFIVTAIVVGLTGAAEALGPAATGIAGTFPVLGAMMALVAQGARGPKAGVEALKGMISALPAFVAFFVVVARLVETTALLACFATATVAALATQGVLWRLASPLR
jgi:hypothetical protein